VIGAVPATPPHTVEAANTRRNSMRKVLLTAAALALSIGTANAQKMGKGGTGVDETSEVPKCVQPFGTMAIVEKRSAASPTDGLPPRSPR